jgi:maltose O-acetyltransferase
MIFLSSFIFALASLFPVHHFCRCRKALYLIAGLKASKSCLFLGKLKIFGSMKDHLKIGKNGVFNDNITFDLGGHIEIQDGVSIGMDCLFTTVSHCHDDPSFRAGHREFKNIVIRNGVWLGARVTILPGVTIGQGAVVGAGSVVNRDLPAHHLCVGVPCKAIRPLSLVNP